MKRMYRYVCAVFNAARRRCGHRQQRVNDTALHTAHVRGSLVTLDGRLVECESDGGDDDSCKWQISECGNIIMLNGQFHDVIMPYQRFVPPYKRPIDIDISLQGPMITRWYGPFVSSREVTPSGHDCSPRKLRRNKWELSSPRGPVIVKSHDLFVSRDDSGPPSTGRAPDRSG